MATRRCPECNAVVPAHEHHRRIFCTKCRPPTPRPDMTPPVLQITRSKLVQQGKVKGTVEPTNVLAATRAELDKAGVTGTALGQAALRAAEAIDSMETSASGFAALLREHRACLAAVFKDVDPGQSAGNALDELRRRRQEKEHAAGG